MPVLYFLEGLRTPVLDTLFSLVTHLGGEAVFLALTLTVLWCIDKKTGYLLLLIGYVGILANQFLKLAFRVPRPWVRDPSFTIVESARAGATGYSFPSGHTQNAIDVFGTLAHSVKRRAWRAVLIALIALVALSRMYLGVHTPWDVGVSLAIGIVLQLALYPLFSRAYDSRHSMLFVLGGFVAAAGALTVYTTCAPFPADMDAENLADGIKNAYTFLGCTIAIVPVYLADRHRLHYRTDAPLPGQVVKLVLGLCLALLVKGVLKAPLLALTGGHPVAHAIRYAILVLFIGIVWPITFPLFRKLGAPRGNADA